MTILPLELETDILSRLPLESILRFRCVCKEWLSVIDSKDFKIPKPLVFFDMKIGDTPAGRIVMELFVDVTPKTVTYFCTGEKGVGKVRIPLHYKGPTFQRVINKFMYQGGDFTCGYGTGGGSIFGAKFADKNFLKKHTGRGVLWMSDLVSGISSLQFFICLVPTRCLDGKYVVFGQVVEGMDIVKAIEAVGSRSGNTSKPVVIADSGQL